ncbi:M28 family metallopeptidase [Luteimonas sp. RIT-PG2_3]
MPPVHHLALTASLMMLSFSACAQEAATPQRNAATTPAANTASLASGSTAATWLDRVSAIGNAAGNTARRDAIEKILQDQSLVATRSALSHDALQGINLLAPVSGDDNAPLLLLGAHYDRVDEGNGITDNASGVGVALELAQRFKARPLQHHRVAVALWDLEEKGLLGAHAYVEQGGEKPALYVNFDVFGWGDTLWMMSPDVQARIVGDSEAATREAGIRLSAGTQYPPTDHLAFLKANWPAVSYSLVDHAEIADILLVFSGKTPANTPKVMRVIHSADDTIAEVDANAVAKGIDAVEAALRRWDAGAKLH